LNITNFEGNKGEEWNKGNRWNRGLLKVCKVESEEKELNVYKV